MCLRVEMYWACLKSLEFGIKMMSNVTDKWFIDEQIGPKSLAITTYDHQDGIKQNFKIQHERSILHI